jgi:hypothetical protein
LTDSCALVLQLLAATESPGLIDALDQETVVVVTKLLPGEVTVGLGLDVLPGVAEPLVCEAARRLQS